MQRSAVVRRICAYQGFFMAKDRSLIEKHDHTERLASAVPKRLDQNVNDLNAAGVAFQRNTFARSGAAGLDGFAERRSQIQPQSPARQCQKLPRGRPGRRFEVFFRSCLNSR